MNKPEPKPEKMSLASMDVAAEKRGELKRYLGQAFPQVFAEGIIDFDQLKRVLGEWVDPGKERFGLNWPGKAECMKIIQQPSVATLKPLREESVDFDATQNLFIEGDNLEILKLFQKAYFGKIKIIYIDPPYNTGGEFIYPDKYAETLETYLAYTGQIDAEGRRFATNTDASGRYHSRWLSMMYPRLYLARNLLTEDGVMLLSISDEEVHHLKELCNDIFGEENFVAQLVWEKTRKNDAKLFSIGHEYLLVYAKSLANLRELKTVWREPKPGAKEIIAQYQALRAKHGDDDEAVQSDLREWYASLPKNHPSKKLSRYKWVDNNGPWRDRDISWPGGGGPRYDVMHPVTKKPCAVPEAGWRFSEPETMQRQIAMGLVVFREDHTQPPFRKAHLVPIPEELDDVEPEEIDEEADSENEEETAVGLQVMPSVIYKQAQVAVKYLRSLMGKKIFDNPKDHEILARLIVYCGGNDKELTVLDFFAGSCSTAESVMRLNAEDGGSRRFIMVQLPEICDPKSAAFKSGYKTIADIGRDRMRRAAEKISSENSGELALEGQVSFDMGFKAFGLSRSNFKVWDADATAESDLGEQIEMHIDHLSDASTAEDVLYELLLKAGFPLTTKVQAIKLAGRDTFSIEDGTLLICLEKEITPELIDALAEANPLQVICLDEGFKGNDQLKANAVQTFRARAKAEESEIVFKTV
ncbi:site-specific DNA-methyltransferase [Bradyrhizobium sp. USDA 241]|uniref:site-specific DNA-methyltransferase n=1 Tax=Bradyrhizobium sp. USDA 241 TaxID=3377725 RepID=UPI003C733B94